MPSRPPRFLRRLFSRTKDCRRRFCQCLPGSIPFIDRIIFAIPPLGHHFIIFWRLFELAEEAVDFLHRDAGTGGDAARCGRLEQFGPGPFLARHRVDDAFNAADSLVIHLRRALRHFARDCRKLVQSAVIPPIFFICANCCLKSSRSEPLARLDLQRQLSAASRSTPLCTSSISDSNVAHAEYARGQCVGMEGLEPHRVSRRRLRT